MLCWKRNQRAAIALAACGAAEAGVALLTDFPGGIARIIDFPTHGKIDMALAGAIFAIPGIMGFAGEPEFKYLRAMGLSITAITGLTDFEGETSSPGWGRTEKNAGLPREYRASQ
jgi:hypothetical protein